MNEITDAEAARLLRQMVQQQLVQEQIRRMQLQAEIEFQTDRMMRRIYDDIQRQNRSAHGTAKL